MKTGFCLLLFAIVRVAVLLKVNGKQGLKCHIIWPDLGTIGLWSKLTVTVLLWNSTRFCLQRNSIILSKGRI